MKKKVTRRQQKKKVVENLVGVIPAAGHGLRIGPIPCSKELFPVGFRSMAGAQELRAKTVSHYLLEKYREAGATQTYIVLRNGKWDIPAYYGDGGMLGMDLAYLVVERTDGPPDTLDRAYPFLKKKVVLFGFPDIIFGPNDAFVHLLQRHRMTDAEVTLGLYPAHDCRVMDMVDVDSKGRVRGMQLKPNRTSLTMTWLCAIWSPSFTEFMHEYMGSGKQRLSRKVRSGRAIDAQGDVPVGAVVQAAIRRGFRVEGVRFPSERYIDIGTPENLVKAVQQAVRLTRLRGQ